MNSHRFLVLLAAVALAAFAAVPRLHAQAELTFTGGDGTPLELSLDAPVTYLVTSSPTFAQEQFVFQGVGNLFQGTLASVSGTMQFSINGGVPFILQFLASGVASGNVGVNDVYAFGTANPPISSGEVAVLTAGTLTTTANFAGAPPSGGSFGTFIAGGAGEADSTMGIAVPEPSTWALSCVGVALLLLLLRRNARGLSIPPGGSPRVA